MHLQQVPSNVAEKLLSSVPEKNCATLTIVPLSLHFNHCFHQSALSTESILLNNPLVLKSKGLLLNPTSAGHGERGFGTTPERRPYRSTAESPSFKNLLSTPQVAESRPQRLKPGQKEASSPVSTGSPLATIPAADGSSTTHKWCPGGCDAAVSRPTTHRQPTSPSRALHRLHKSKLNHFHVHGTKVDP